MKTLAKIILITLFSPMLVVWCILDILFYQLDYDKWVSFDLIDDILKR